MQEPKLFLPKKGNYQDLASYKKATVIYDLTFYFAKHFLVKGDRTIDQMVQAARSGKQNIAEGCAAAATSAETELKLVNVARASMKELLVDYEDYLRVRNLQMWTFDDNRTQKTREFCKKHDLSKDFMHDIDRRSDEAIANITITLLHQFDNIIGAYIAHLEKTFVEQGGIRERMTAARLGYRNSQQARIAELEQENRSLKARIAELEQKLKGLIGHIGLIGLIGHIGLISLIGLIGLMGLSSCGGDAAPQLPQQPASIQQPITFSGTEGREQTVTRAATTPLSTTIESFQVWGHKNMSYNAGEYDGRQTVFQGYQVDWKENTAATSATNTNGWEYILTGKPEQTIKYWDWSAKAYRFFAVTRWSGKPIPATPAEYKADKPYEAYGAYTAYTASGDYKAYSVSLLADTSSPGDTPYFSRLWFSTGDPTAYPDKQFGRPVTLEFIKPFARVRFILTYTNPREGLTIGAKSFLPTNGSKIYKKGILTVTYPLTGTETEETFTTQTYDSESDSTYISEDYDPENDLKEYPTNAPEGWYTVVPNTKQGSYTLTVTINKAGKTAVVPATYMQWLPGYSYTYVFRVNDEGGIEIGWVDYAVTPWIEAPATHEVYNW